MKQGERVHYGSLADQLKHEQDRPPQGVAPLTSDLSRVPTVTPRELDRMDLGEDAQASIRRREALVRNVELMNKAQKLTVPTDDAAVRKRLRSYQEPITLFGEGPFERRERLRMIMARMEASGISTTEDKPEMVRDDIEEEQTATYYTAGPPEIKDVRRFIAQYSMERASQRLKLQRETYQKYESEIKSSKQNNSTDAMDTSSDAAVHSTYINLQIESKKKLFLRLKTFANATSEVGDVRPISATAIAPRLDAENRQVVLTGSWTGAVKLWSLADSKHIRTFRGHEERITGVAINPQYPSALLGFATAGADNTAKLWSLAPEKENDPLIATLEGHDDRLGKIDFHPSGRFLGTTSFDCTWRLWDVSRPSPLYEQEGHSMPVYDIAFHNDGSLAATTDLGGITLIWDLRTGKSILPLQGHVHQILSVDFSPNGFHVITGSDDHTCRVWDLRTRKCLYNVPAHNKLISHVQYEPNHGRYFITCSYDMTIKLWNSVEFKLIKVIKEIDSRILSADLGKYLPEGNQDRDAFVVGTYDKTWKSFLVTGLETTE
jgi:U4/U6 small nuclear ribonucleoprotein PRP4